MRTQERRPYLATECNDISKAEKFRLQASSRSFNLVLVGNKTIFPHQIIREISRKVSQIQNRELMGERVESLNGNTQKMSRLERRLGVK